MSARLTIVGDAMLDRDLDGRATRLCPDAPAPVIDDAVPHERPGGAGLAALLAAQDGHAVTLVTGLGLDDAGQTVARLLADAGVRVVDAGLTGRTPEKVRVRADGHVVARMDHGGNGTPGDITVRGRRALAHADAVLVSDYGRGMSSRPGVRDALADTPAPVLWDPHPRGAAPVAGAALVTPNAKEAAALAPAGDEPAAWARALVHAFAAQAVAVTLGADGAVLAERGKDAVAVPAPRVPEGDACGAGDRLASAAAGAMAGGCAPAEAVRAAVAAAAAFVSAGGAAATGRPRATRDAPAEHGRTAGGVIVATGGCFDLLHAGHVTMLEAARALGDRLVVLLNSDASVRRLKGPDRPLVGEEDRARVLGALRCVDEVRVFDDDTPERALAELAPDIWAKGADYDPERLPEAATVRGAGGRVVGLPFVAGRSTTRLIKEAAERVAL